MNPAETPGPPRLWRYTRGLTLPEESELAAAQALDLIMHKPGEVEIYDFDAELGDGVDIFSIPGSVFAEYHDRLPQLLNVATTIAKFIGATSAIEESDFDLITYVPGAKLTRHQDEATDAISITALARLTGTTETAMEDPKDARTELVTMTAGDLLRMKNETIQAVNPWHEVINVGGSTVVTLKRTIYV